MVCCSVCKDTSEESGTTGRGQINVAIRQQLHVSGPWGWVSEALNDRAAPTKTEDPKEVPVGFVPYMIFDRGVSSFIRKYI